MVVDKQYQHLIAWTYSGTSFIVCNITEFSRDVLPKHFKHNNFSSFVRQLNMYGFHKVNKSPRGHRTLAENQIWEFSHPKFSRGRPDLLEEIKRKALDSDVVRKDNGDANSLMVSMKMAQSDMMQQLVHLQENFAQVVRELAETRRRQNAQQAMMKSMMEFMTKQYGALFPPELNFDAYDVKSDPERPPPIYVTSHDANANTHQSQHFYFGNQQSPSPSRTSTPEPNYSHLPTRPPAPLTVQTQNLHHQSPRLDVAIPTMDPSPLSPSSSSLSAYQAAINTPLPPSPNPCAFLSDDDATSMYSPRSPHTPNIIPNTDNNYQHQQHYFLQHTQQNYVQSNADEATMNLNVSAQGLS
ncbi:hypothetical protein EC973_005024 [Apophysomyces ossiformis]|uniref:HSF-type DNA-binding domain-containing protein n=1 Tax=Apophysomyces ossiformis TaxID=679940 RepID=A0A8H7ES93_9FUNG|nr:hypothetical protein EC973_005024 [Apophysomyces ossiformis]